MNEEQLKSWEIRIASNISFLEWILKNYGDMTLRRDKTEIKNGEPQNLSNIIEDLENIRQEIDEEETDQRLFNLRNKIKFYCPKGNYCGKATDPEQVFLVIPNTEKDCADDGCIMTYAPIGQHSEAFISYLDECIEISKEEYLEISKGIYTPEEYLK